MPRSPKKKPKNTTLLQSEEPIEMREVERLKICMRGNPGAIITEKVMIPVQSKKEKKMEKQLEKFFSSLPSYPKTKRESIE